MTFGQYIKELRLERGMSQKALGRRTRVDHTAISRNEREERMIGRDRARRLAGALCTTDEERATYALLYLDIERRDQS